MLAKEKKKQKCVQQESEQRAWIKAVLMMRVGPSMAFYRKGHQTTLSGCRVNTVVVNVKGKGSNKLNSGKS